MPIEVKNLSHIYMRGTPMENKALENVCMCVEDGEFIGIIGHTGSGKSTLISHLNALEKSEKGCVFVNGMDLGEKGVKLSEIRRSVGLVFQYPEYQLFEETVEKDIAFGPNNLKLSQEEVKNRVSEAMALVGLDEKYREVSPFSLSGGQKRRVAIAGVLAMKPDVIILDESTAMLDPSGRREVMSTVHRLNREEGISVVIITHYMSEAATADYLIVMDEGRIAMTGTPRDVFRQVEKVRALGLDVPPMTDLAHMLRADGVDMRADVLTVDEMVEEVCRLSSSI